MQLGFGVEREPPHACFAGGGDVPGRFDGVAEQDALGVNTQRGEQVEFPLGGHLEPAAESGQVGHDRRGRVAFDGVVDPNRGYGLRQQAVAGFDGGQIERQERCRGVEVVEDVRV